MDFFDELSIIMRVNIAINRSVASRLSILTKRGNHSQHRVRFSNFIETYSCNTVIIS